MLFSRPDGTRIRDISPLRKTMPLVLKARHEAAMYHPMTFDLTRTLPWLDRYNEVAEGPRAHFFHWHLWCSARNFHAWPQINRFVAGRHAYDREGVQISFSVKKSMEEDAPVVLTKMEMPEDESFPALIDRVAARVGGARGDGEGGLLDLELVLIDKLPALVVGAAIDLLRWADRYALLPSGFIAGDPLFTSLIVANLGSVGLRTTFHHLNDYGTASLFGTIGKIEQRPLVIGGEVVVRDVVDVFYTMDERIFDGFYAARAIEHLKTLVEDPVSAAGEPEQVARLLHRS